MSNVSSRQFHTQDGVQLAFDTCGDTGPVVVLLHGALARS